MQNTIHARGILAHHFWGTYSATIGLQFDSAECARDALKVLGGKWKKSKRPEVLVWYGNSPELAECKKVLGSYGADVGKIDSLKTSIDYGENFEVDIPAVPEKQGKLKGM